jgi:hypothetical protein
VVYFFVLDGRDDICCLFLKFEFVGDLALFLFFVDEYEGDGLCAKHFVATFHLRIYNQHR